MGTEFLPPEELMDASLRESWFELIKSIEALKEHRSADIALESSLSRAGELAAETERRLELICTSAMHLIPEKRKFYDSSMQEVSAALEKLSRVMGRDLENLRLYLELMAEVRLRERKLEIQRRRIRELRQEMLRACEEAEVLKESYEKSAAGIRAQTDERLAEIRDSFLTEAERILGGCRVCDERGEAVPPEILFENLIKDVGYHEKIKITGLFLKRDSLRQMLRELADEASKKIPPLLEEERRELSKLEAERRKLKHASNVCDSLRRELEEGEERERKLENRLRELKLRTEAVEERFASYSSILSLRDDYLGILETASAARKELFLALEEDFRDFLPQERDAEKRELREELVRYSEMLEQAKRRLEEAEKEAEKVMQLAEKLTRLEDENMALNSKIDTLNKESMKMQEKLERLSGEKASLTEERDRLKAEIEKERDLRKAAEIEKKKISTTLKEEKARLETLLSTLNTQLKEKEDEIEGLTKQIERLRREKKIFAEELNRLKLIMQKNEKLVEELNGRESSLKTQIEEVLAEKLRIEEEVLSTRKELNKERELRLSAEKIAAALESELSERRERCGELEQTCAELGEEAESLREEVKRLRRLLEERLPAKPREVVEDEAYLSEKIDALRRR
ncbi:hypothetical protein [Candidatus Pyrohabitans sp.]